MNQIGGSDIFGELNVDVEAKDTLKNITKWAKLAAIVGIISAALSMVSAASGITKTGGDQLTAMVMRGSLIFIIPVAVALILLNIFLLRFATSTGSSLDNMSQAAFNMGISFLKMYFKTLGIIIIIVIALVIILLIAFGLGLAAGGR